MGDMNNYQQGKDLQQQQQYAGAGMEALISAIEYQGRTSAAQAAGGFPMMANVQDHKTTSSAMQQEEAEKYRFAQQLNSQVAAAAAAAGLYPGLQANALAAAGITNPLWGLNPMLMHMSPGVSGLRTGNLLPQGAVPSLPMTTRDRETLAQSEALLGKRIESSDPNKPAELSGLPFGYHPGLSYLHQPGVPADKVPSVHESAANGLQYPQLASLSQYLPMPGYPNMVSGNATSMLPNILPGGLNLNPSALGALGAYPYYQGGLRFPYVPQMGQNPMIRMPMMTGMSTPPTQSRTPEASLKPESPHLDPRPQSGGYLPLSKENLTRRLSAPNPGTASQFRMPMRTDALGRIDGRKPNAPYPGFHHRTHLPSQLIAPTSEQNKHHRPKPVIDPKSIEQRISQIISQNEKILFNPSLDKVKPRRVFRRSSLDPSSLSSPIPTHNPLTVTHSAPRTLEPKYHKPLLKEKSASIDRPNYLTVPSRLTEPQNGLQSSRPFRTVLPDPRRDPNAIPYVPGYTGEPRHSTEPSTSQDLSQLLGRPEYRHKESFRCDKCGAQFTRHETYEAHKTLYCTKRPNLPSMETSTMRQSVIQHTSVPSADESPETQGFPEVKVTPPPETQIESTNRELDTETPLRRSKLLENPMRYIHKDLHRAHSADAALQIPRRLGESPFVADSPLSSKTSPGPKTPASPPITEPNVPSKFDTHLPSKSSIPTDKLPPKKKQLQLMRSNSSNKSQIESTRSPGHNPSPLTSDLSPPSRESKTPEESPPAPPIDPLPPYQRLQPPTSLALDTPSRKALPPWIPLEREDKGPGVSVDQAPIYLTEPSSQNVVFPSSSGSVLPSPTGGKSPTSPKSPSRRASPSRSSRSPSRSPTSSNLESTVPRSNYKLLLHQISLRNMQDMGYLSEAYHNSRDKTLKRNIASLLWSSNGPNSDGSSSKRMRPFGPSDGPSMEELYPGKASLARRLSPDSRAARLHDTSGISPSKVPLSQSRSRPYESTLKIHPTVTRSHSAGFTSDVNNNIKQFLQNKSRNQQQPDTKNPSTSQPPTKGHKPLTRTHANARYLLKSPTKPGAPKPIDPPSGLAGKTLLESRSSLSKIGSNSADNAHRLKESLAVKRASSYNPDTTVDYQSKRQKLIPITKQSSTSTHAILPPSLVTSRLTEHIPTTSEVKELPKIKSVNPHTVQTPFLLHPHWSPSLGFEPHPTFCSLVSPQPMYVELQQSTLSMYSQWAVSEPLLLPKGMTVMDMFNSTKFLRPLSPYISHNSLYVTPSAKDDFNVTDSKNYELKDKEKDSNSVEKPDQKTGLNKSEPDVTEDSKTSMEVDDAKEKGDEKAEQDPEKNRDWMFSQMINSRLLGTSCCYTSCHNKVSGKPYKKSDSTAKATITGDASKNDSKLDSKMTEKKYPKLPPPKIIIDPPSPESLSSDSDDDDHSECAKNDIVALEFSDCDSDDDVIKGQNEPFLKLEKRPITPPRPAPPSPSHPIAPFVLSLPTPPPSLDLPRPSPVSPPSGQIATESTAEPKVETDISKNDELSDSETESSLQIDEIGTETQLPNGDKIPSKNADDSVSHKKCSDMSHESGHSEEGKGESSNGGRKKHKKIRKSRKERNASSPRAQKRIDGSPESPLDVLEDPSLAVHPIGACSDDPAKICALCRMKAEGPKSSEDGAEHPDTDPNNNNCNGKSEIAGKNDEGDNAKPSSPSAAGDCPDTPNRPHTPTTPKVCTPTSTRPRTPVPLTVSVPKRSRDRASSKSGNQPLTPGILDKARGKGTTQHWVTTTDLQTPQPSAPKQAETSNTEDKNSDSQTETKTEKSTTKSRTLSTSEYYSTMPPNKNPVLELSLQQKAAETSTPSPSVTQAQNGGMALAAVVSGVMRSAAIQSLKKTKSSKHEMTELLSHSRPLIPASDLNGSANKNHGQQSEKVKNTEPEKISDKNTENVLGSLANLTANVGPNAVGNRGKPSLRHLSLSSRETELFLNKANEPKTPSLNERKSEADILKGELDEQSLADDIDDGHHSDGAKEDSLEIDGESSNPRPHKCLECKVAFRIAGHLAKHLRSKGHIIAMQKKTLNRLKQQRLSTVTGQEAIPGGQGVNVSGSQIPFANSPEALQPANQEELLTQLGEGAETLAQAQVRALFEGNEEYTEINRGMEGGAEAFAEASDDEGEFSAQSGSSDPRPFKCIACKVAFRFQGHLDRHFRSNTHLLAVGHFERDATSTIGLGNVIPNMGVDGHISPRPEDYEMHDVGSEIPSILNSENKMENLQTVTTVSHQVCENVEKETKFSENSNFEGAMDQNCSGIANIPSTQVGESSKQNELQPLDNRTVNQDFSEFDWSKQTSIKINNLSNHPKETVNGRVSHSLPQTLVETPKSDSLIQMSIKRQSPVVQSSPKAIFEATPTIPEMPLPSTSPVHKRQQLTC